MGSNPIFHLKTSIDFCFKVSYNMNMNGTVMDLFEHASGKEIKDRHDNRIRNCKHVWDSIVFQRTNFNIFKNKMLIKKQHCVNDCGAVKTTTTILDDNGKVIQEDSIVEKANNRI